MIFSHHSLSRDLVQDGDTYLMTKKSKGVGLCPYRFSIDENLLIRIKSSKATTTSKETKHDVDIDTLFSPDHNSTAVLVGDKLYAGTAADYQVRVQQQFRRSSCSLGSSWSMFLKQVDVHVVFKTGSCYKPTMLISGCSFQVQVSKVNSSSLLAP